MQKSYYYCDKNGKDKEFVINNAKFSDLAEILKVFRLVRESVYAEWFCSMDGHIAEAIIDDESIAMVVKYEGKIIAFGSAITTGEKTNTLANDLTNNNINIPKGKNSELHHIFVHPGFRGYGLQRALINSLCDEAASKGRDIMFAICHPENIYSSRNFDKCGFIRANPEPLAKFNSKRDYWFKIII